MMNKKDGNGRIQSLQVSPINTLNEAVLVLSLGSTKKVRTQAQQWLQAMNEHVFTIRNIGSATLSLAWLAAGRLDIIFYQNIKPWDVATGALLIEEAGGVFTNTRGSGFDWVGNAGDCLATNGRVHTSTLKILAQHKI